MRRDRVLAVADLIERETAQPTMDVGFQMADYIRAADDSFPDLSGHSCGTVACIAGWAVIASMPRGPFSLSGSACHFRARDSLELTDKEADDLFMWSPGDLGLDEVTPDMAVRTLRHLAETGRVDWDAANPQIATGTSDK